MRLYIKQKILALGDQYDIYDENQNVIFRVKSELFTFLSKMRLYDKSGLEIFYIEKEFSWFLSKYSIQNQGMEVAKISQEFSFPSKSFSITAVTGDYFTLEGDMLGWSFTILKNSMPYASLSKKFMAWGDSYEINVYDNSELSFATAIVVAIDNCLHNGRRNSSLIGG